MYKNIDHICILSKEAESLSEWYCQMFNFDIALKMKREPPIYFLKLGERSLIEIIPIENENGKFYNSKEIGYNHISIIVDDFGKACDDLISKGVKLTEARLTSQGWKIAYLKDPEDNIVQIEYRQKMLW